MNTADLLFVDNARCLAKGSTCDRAAVGSVLVNELYEIIGLGCNSAPGGQQTCHQAGHLMFEGHCKRTVHAEARAILYAARQGNATAKATLYTTHNPCIDCANLLIEAGIERIVYAEQYRDMVGVERLEEAGIKVERWYMPAEQRLDDADRAWAHAAALRMGIQEDKA